MEAPRLYSMLKGIELVGRHCSASRQCATEPMEEIIDYLSPIPTEPLPCQGTLGFRVQRYGMTCWGDLFTSRQKIVMLTLLDALRKTKERYSEQAADFVAVAISRFSDISNALCQRIC